jgi:hypothetical protein
MQISDSHKQKYSGLLQLLETSKKQKIDIITTTVSALGDNFEELVTNLELIGESGLMLAIVSS